MTTQGLTGIQTTMAVGAAVAVGAVLLYGWFARQNGNGTADRERILVAVAKWLADKRGINQADALAQLRTLVADGQAGPLISDIWRIEASYEKLSPSQVRETVRVLLKGGSDGTIATMMMELPWEDTPAAVRATFIKENLPKVEFVLVERKDGVA